MKVRLYIYEKLRELIVFRSSIDVKSWLDRSGIVDYTINEDLIVDVKGNVDITRVSTILGLSFLPVKFGRVLGNFNCNKTNLISLLGTPDFVGKNFDCSSRFDIRRLSC